MTHLKLVSFHSFLFCTFVSSYSFTRNTMTCHLMDNTKVQLLLLISTRLSLLGEDSLGFTIVQNKMISSRNNKVKRICSVLGCYSIVRRSVATFIRTLNVVDAAIWPVFLRRGHCSGKLFLPLFLFLSPPPMKMTSILMKTMQYSPIYWAGR